MSKPDLKITKIPKDTCPEITYPIILIDDAKKKNAINEFLNYLLSEKTKPAIEKYGFKKIE